MITVTDLSKSFGATSLFEQCNLQLDPGHIYGIVGANGSGKSTLLKIISGAMEATTGSVTIAKRARLGILDQDHFKYENVSILETVMQGNRDLWQAITEKETLLANAADHFDVDRYSALEDVVLQYDGYGLESRAAAILEGLNIPTRLHREPMSALSGGFKLRCLLGQVLASEPDVLLLDEPTNHLDIVSIAWMERFLAKFTGVVLVVSHDHRFLDTVCSDIIDVDYQRVMSYKGNYTAFEAAKAEERGRKEAEIEKREKEIAEQQAFVDRFKAKASKARQAQSRVKKIAKLVIEELPPSSRRYPRFKFKQRRPSGKRVIEATGISKAYDRPVLEDVDVRIMRGDRVAVIGPNGIGKSTLLKILVGQVQADAGEYEWGHETHIGYFAQDHRELVEGATASETVESWLWSHCNTQPIGFVKGKLAEVLFGRDDTDKKVSTISGGESARLVFARLGIAKPNVMILDEPTNHLDLEGIEALAQALEAFDGTLIFVSHDRWFVGRLATRILAISPDGVEDFPGGWDDYLAAHGADYLELAQAKG